MCRAAQGGISGIAVALGEPANYCLRARPKRGAMPGMHSVITVANRVDRMRPRQKARAGPNYQPDRRGNFVFADVLRGVLTLLCGGAPSLGRVIEWLGKGLAGCVPSLQAQVRT